MLYWMLCFRMHVVKRESRKKNMFRSTHFHHDSEVHGLIPHSKLYHPRDLIVNMRPKRSKKLEDPTWRIQEPQTTDRSLEFSSNNWSRLWKYSSLVGNFNPKKNTWVQFVAMYVRLPEESNVYIYYTIICAGINLFQLGIGISQHEAPRSEFEQESPRHGQAKIPM